MELTSALLWGGKPFGTKDNRRSERSYQPKIYHPFDDSSIPKHDYFAELERVTKERIIWGGNYFLDYLPATPCFIVWDKENGESFFADCELAWTSFKTATRIFRFRWAGMLQGNMKHKEDRFHPTQKPVALYKWLLSKYAKPGDKILDTHLGSGSSRIAAYDLGFDFVGCEIDKVYFDLEEKRFEEHTKQTRMILT